MAQDLLDLQYAMIWESKMFTLLSSVFINYSTNLDYVEWYWEWI